jgi:hypothetical protein
MLASKIICDDTYSNKSWCIIAQKMFQLREINQMERKMCSYLKWQLNVEPGVLSNFKLASKIICNNTYSNKSWCIIAQKMSQLREINQMERKMCLYLEWQLNVEPGVLSDFRLASKIICNSTYSNKSWCIITQQMFQLREINQMERKMCSYLKWQLNIKPSVLSDFQSCIKRNFAGPGLYPPLLLPLEPSPEPAPARAQTLVLVSCPPPPSLTVVSAPSISAQFVANYSKLSAC